jgi:Tol biopolymer transport system component
MTATRSARLGVACALIAAVSSGCTWINRVSVDSAGTGGDSGSGGFYGAATPNAISADGRYVAFVSNADNLVASDTNGVQDVFVRDAIRGTTSRVSVDSHGVQADLSSSNPSISADGRYVAFDSDATTLAPGTDNNATNIFVHDAVTGTTSLVSPYGFDPTISADGRYVAFTSGAAVVPGDTNNDYDVFVHDTVAGNTARVSVDSNGTQANGASGNPTISADGRYIAFDSNASNLVAGDTNGTYDVFVHDTVSATTSRVSVDSNGAQANFGGDTPAISADGRSVAFTSRASTLVAGDTNGTSDVFVHDRVMGTTSRVSIDSTGVQGNDGSYSDYATSVSGDGRYVTFTSVATNLVSGDTNDSGDVFAHDNLTGVTSRASVTSFGVQGAGSSSGSAISADGRYIAFMSNADNLVANDTGWEDVFLRPNPEPTVTSLAPAVLPRGATTAVTITGTGFYPGAVLSVTGGGITATNITVVSPTKLTAVVMVQAGTTPGTRNLLVGLHGTGPRAGSIDAWGLCPNCATIP